MLLVNYKNNAKFSFNILYDALILSYKISKIIIVAAQYTLSRFAAKLALEQLLFAQTVCRV